MRHISNDFNWLGAALPVLLGVGLGACSYLPDVGQFKLPQVSSFIPTSANEFNRASVNTGRPVSAADLVDRQGHCPGMAAPATDNSAEPGSASERPPIRGVGLDMTECEVVHALGPPRTTDIGNNARGERNVVMTYSGTERAGTYRFVAGRLVSIERGPEPPAEEKPAKKPAPKKQAKKPQPT